MGTKAIRLVVSAGLLALMAPLAHATLTPPPSTITDTIQLGTVYTGSTPDGSSPWLTATFTAASGSMTGMLTLTSNLSAADFLQGLGSSSAALGWGFYLPGMTISSISCMSGTCADNGALFGGNYNSGPVPGGFNLAFGWSSGNRFASGSTVTYQLTFTSALTSSPFGLNGSDWVSVAHVQGITGGCSGWIVSGSGTAPGGGQCLTQVPEPGVLGVFSLGLITIAALVEVRRRRVARGRRERA